jgi:hypothetical protein
LTRGKNGVYICCTITSPNVLYGLRHWFPHMEEITHSIGEHCNCMTYYDWDGCVWMCGSPWTEGTISSSWKLRSLKTYLVSPKHKNMDWLSRGIQKTRLKYEGTMHGRPMPQWSHLDQTNEKTFMSHIFPISSSIPILGSCWF